MGKWLIIFVTVIISIIAVAVVLACIRVGDDRER